MRIDFAAQHPEFPGRMVRAVEANGASYHSAGSARDRDWLRQQHLERLGCRFYRIWSIDWFADPDTEVAKICAAYDQASHPFGGKRPSSRTRSNDIPN